MLCLPRKIARGVAYIEFIIGGTVFFILSYFAFATADWISKNESVQSLVSETLSEIQIIPLTISGGSANEISVAYTLLDSELEKAIDNARRRAGEDFPEVSLENLSVACAYRVARIDTQAGTFLGFDARQSVLTHGRFTQDYFTLLDRAFSKKVSSTSVVSPIAIPFVEGEGIERFFPYTVLVGLYVSLNPIRAPAQYISQLRENGPNINGIKVVELRGGVV